RRVEPCPILQPLHLSDLSHFPSHLCSCLAPTSCMCRIVNDPKNESWIRWTENGTAFKFSSSDKLLAALQAAGLRAQNYHSVEKNLNDYRFNRLTDQRRKIPDTDGKLWWMFSHTMFHRDFPDQIVRIQRRRRTNPPTMSPQLPLIAPHPQMPTPPVPQQYVQQQQHHVQQHQQAYQVPPPHAAQHQNPQWM
ncbi:Heat shock transcription factor, partial [Linderina macrospora]